jgi:hypothetical protein
MDEFDKRLRQKIKEYIRKNKERLKKLFKRKKPASESGEKK